MAFKFTNNAAATLASSITSTGTSITLTTGNGALFPALSGSDYFNATLIDSSNNIEIVKVTARSGDVLTVVRGQDGTAGRAYAAGDKCELRITAAVLSNFLQLDGAQTFTGTLTSSGATLAGTWAGTPTFSGAATFSGAVVFSGNPSFTGTPSFSGTPTFSAGAALGSGTYTGNATFNGNITLSGNPNFSGVIQSSVITGGSGGGFFFQDRVTATNQFGWYSTSNIARLYKSISASNADVLTVDGSGNLTATGNVTAYSDESLKTNWRNLPANFVELLAGIKHGIYDRVDTHETHAGVSANDMERMLAPVVHTDESGKKSLAYGNAALVACVELAQRLLSVEQELVALKGA